MDYPGALRLSAAQAERLRRIRGREPDAFYPAKAKEERIDGYASVELLLNEGGFVPRSQRAA